LHEQKSTDIQPVQSQAEGDLQMTHIGVTIRSNEGEYKAQEDDDDDDDDDEDEEHKKEKREKEEVQEVRYKVSVITRNETIALISQNRLHFFSQPQQNRYEGMVKPVWEVLKLKECSQFSQKIWEEPSDEIHALIHELIQTNIVAYLCDNVHKSARLELSLSYLDNSMAATAILVGLMGTTKMTDTNAHS
jgi:ABC-type cobalt transport system substrate-binding protein